MHPRTTRHALPGLRAPHATGCPRPTAPHRRHGADSRDFPPAAAPPSQADKHNGLTNARAAELLAQYGPNELADGKRNKILLFLSFFWGA